MNEIPSLVSAPGDLISLAIAKEHCRVDGSDHDDLLNALVLAATSHLDGWMGILGRCLVTQDWKLEFDCWATFVLPLDPVQEIVSITYYDTAGALQTVASDIYKIITTHSKVSVICKTDKTWPEADNSFGPISVTWRAGFGDAADVPQAIKQAMLLMIGHWFEAREAVIIGTISSELPMAVSALLQPYRKALI